MAVVVIGCVIAFALPLADLSKPPTVHPGSIVFTSSSGFGLSGSVNNLTPGGPQSLVLTATNAFTSDSLNVNSVTVQLTSVDATGSSTTVPDCSPTNLSINATPFSTVGSSVTVSGLSVPVNAQSSATFSIPIALVATTANPCQNVTFNFGYSGTATYTDATTTILASSANPSSVGQQVLYTATVSPGVSGETPAPTGTVTFKDNGVAISCAAVGSQSFDGTTASCLVTYASTAGSPHPIVATFSSADTNYSGSTSTTLYQVVQTNACVTTPTSGATTILTGTYTGNYEVKNGTSLWIDGGTVTGNVTVDATGQLAGSNGTIQGNLTSSGGAVALQGTALSGNLTNTNAPLSLGPGTTVTGNVMVSGNAVACAIGVTSQVVNVSGNFTIQSVTNSTTDTVCSTTIVKSFTYQSNGSPAVIGASTGCAGNTVGGNFTVQSNTAKVTVGATGTGNGNAVTGNIMVSGNTGGGTLTNNSAGGNCALSNDKPGIAGTSNTAKGNNSCDATA